jgi:hypothetical protein
MDVSSFHQRDELIAIFPRAYRYNTYPNARRRAFPPAPECCSDIPLPAGVNNALSDECHALLGALDSRLCATRRGRELGVEIIKSRCLHCQNAQQ